MIYYLKNDYFTSDFLKKCKQNPNIPQDISKETRYIIKQSALKGVLYFRRL